MHLIVIFGYNKEMWQSKAQGKKYETDHRLGLEYGGKKQKENKITASSVIMSLQV